MLDSKIFVKNLEIFYKVVGEGNPLPTGRQVLILHGWGSKSDYWLKTAQLMAKRGVKVIIPDLPGFGKSNKPPWPWNLDEYCFFIKEFADSLGLKDFYLLGHSFGGSLAAKLALKYPKRITKLFLVGAACIRKKTFKKKVLLVFSKVFKIFSYIPLFKKAFYKFVVKSDYPNTKGFMKKTYLNIIKEDLINSLEKINIPTIIIWGENDNVIPLKYGQLINSKIKNSKLIVIPHGTHDLERKIPSILAKKILCCL